MHPLSREALKALNPYVPGKPPEEVMRELNLHIEIEKLASNENMLGPSPLAVEAIRRKAEDMNFYPDDTAYYLKKKLSKHIGVGEEEIIIGNGSVEIMLMLGLAFVEPGESIVASAQSFIMYRIVGQITNAHIIEPPLRPDKRIDLYAMRKAIKEDTKIVFIANPNNPTGTYNWQEEVEDFMKDIPDNVIVVWDEAYYEFVDPARFKDTIQYVRDRRNCIILRTFSKAYGLAGLRVGYGIAKESIISSLYKVKLPFNANRMGQIAALYALDDAEHIKKSRELVTKGKNLLYEEFKKLGLSYLETTTNFIWVEFKRPAHEIYEALLKKGIIARPLKNYGFEKALRITIGREEQNRKLISALKDIL